MQEQPVHGPIKVQNCPWPFHGPSALGTADRAPGPRSSVPGPFLPALGTADRAPH